MLVFAGLISTRDLQADGGTMLFRENAGPFVVTAFCDPVPVRVGSADLSVMVQKASDQSNVLDATVSLRLRRSDNGSILEVVAPATHAKATNKLLYAAHVTLSSPGNWHLAADIKQGGETASAVGELNVLPKEPEAENYWAFFLMVPALIVAFMLNRWLRKKWGISRHRARP